MAAHGLHLRPRDLAKIGQLMLQQGTFLGRRVVSSDWCALATTAQVPRGPSGTKHADLEYGYYYWLVPEYGAFSGWGHGGQYVFVHPGQQLVIAKTALPDTDDLHGARLEDFVELVSPLLTST